MNKGSFAMRRIAASAAANVRYQTEYRLVSEQTGGNPEEIFRPG
jgi:hypothetical protein